ncbi:MAG: DUF11 domain-containing protein [Candidatus Pacebacteria bacterium]|nr:DUF11 domain-containing protein [Candidatus Paceibacterota bacterium]
MFLKKKKIEIRLLGLFLSFALTFNPFIVPMALAGEEEIEIEEPTVSVGAESQDEPAETAPADGGPVPTQTETETASDSTTQTGDARSSAQTETEVNVQQDCLEGGVDQPEGVCDLPELDFDCGECGCGGNNDAGVANEASASADTGGNAVTGSEGEADLTTGDATASASAQNTVNKNTFLIESPLEATASAQEASGSASEASSSARPEGETEEERTGCGEDVDSGPENEIINQNQAAVTNNLTAEANTGANQADDNQGGATVETGDARALANLLNFINANIVGSQFEIMLDNYLDGYEGELDLNQIWQEMLGEGGDWQLIEKDGRFFLVWNNNVASLVNEVKVAASTGGNQADDNGGETAITTGSAQALANVVNLVNLNLIGSQFFLGVFNILGDFTGDLILPRPENFLPSVGEAGSTEGGVEFLNHNQAGISSRVSAEADTGHNQSAGNEGSTLTTTGGAVARTNVFEWVNTNVSQNYWFTTVVNHLGSWFGGTLNWSAPGSWNPGDDNLMTAYQIIPSPSPEEAETAADSGAVVNQNQATVETKIDVSAATGGNQADDNQGEAVIKTGSARALANLFDLVNFNFLGGRSFLGLINILGNWRGNVVFAYPDVVVSLTNGLGEVQVGEMTSFTVSYRNQGYDLAEFVWAQLQFPPGIAYVSDTSGMSPNINGQDWSWFLGDLERGESGQFKVTVRVEPDYNPVATLGFWQGFKNIFSSRVYAAEPRREYPLIVNAAIATPDPESNLENNLASVRTIVFYPEETPELVEEEKDAGGIDPRLPVLKISGWNNVAEFVYPGDTVTFEIEIKNTADVPSLETIVYQELYNGVPDKGFGSAAFDIGTVEPGGKLILSFGLQLADDGILPAGFYHTEAQAYGFGPGGEEIASNITRTDFAIQWKEIAPLFEARASGREEEILGLIDQAECLPEKESILPYLLSLLVSSFWLVEKSRQKIALLRQPADDSVQN